MPPFALSLTSLAQILLINTVLSGDNALVIAVAARHLPPHQRRAAMLWGGAFAIALQIFFTLAIGYVMNVPGVRFVGGVLLLGIACKLVQDEVETARSGSSGTTSLAIAVCRISLANLLMSLENIVAVAGISGSDPVLMIVGLLISATTILVFSQVILGLMNGFRWIVYAGTGVLALTAAGMMVHDLDAVRLLSTTTSPALQVPPWADWSFRLATVGLCTTSGLCWPRRVPVMKAV